MRNKFINTLEYLAEQDERIVFLTGDLGFSVVENFQQKFPQRFYNVGIAEQNMAGIAVGLAEAGMIPFIYSIAPFSLVRPFEFIKNGAILHNLPIRIVAIGAGFEYGDLGFTHYLLEDIALTRIYNNLTCYAPVNNLVAEQVLVNSYDHSGPVYYRISKNLNSLAEAQVSKYKQENIVSLQNKKNAKVAVFAHAEILEEALQVKETESNFDLFSIIKYNPLPREELLDILKKYDKVVTMEAHYKNNGLGSMIAEIIAEENLNIKFKRLGLETTDFSLLGNKNFMYQNYGVGKADLISSIKI